MHLWHIPRRTLTAPGILKAKGFKSWLLLMVLPLQATWELPKNTGVKRSMTQQQSVAQNKKRQIERRGSRPRASDVRCNAQDSALLKDPRPVVGKWTT